MSATVFPFPRFTTTQIDALAALRSRPIVRVGSFWRLKGAPSPIVNAFALSVLLAQGLIVESTPDVVTLTPTGRDVVRILEHRA